MSNPPRDEHLWAIDLALTAVTFWFGSIVEKASRIPNSTDYIERFPKQASWDADDPQGSWANHSLAEKSATFDDITNDTADQAFVPRSSKYSSGALQRREAAIAAASLGGLV